MEEEGGMDAAHYGRCRCDSGFLACASNPSLSKEKGDAMQPDDHDAAEIVP